ncbi:nucleotidyl transferase AbiEii/AbiGii toxin family protein, partial [uncultured Alteromonas sp.]|uniref:nucleotidyl transferase AbiEii/AbiGii toxin family protein n=1 Tax=uncultured Alteromonas sp. TaxID=179113 RepID=UPI0025F09C96
LIVGATARDIILVHGYNAAIERGTRDVDFGLEVPSWEHYQKMRDALIESGFTAHPKKTHQLSTTDSDGLSWEIDLIPFGGVSDAEGQITWPPEHDFQMSVLGFDEAYKHAWDVLLNKEPALRVKVASPAGILLLKLIAWTERGREYQGKDAIDIYYVIKHYSKIPDVFEALYERDYMELQDYDDMKASAMMLADEVAAMAHGDTLNYIRQTLLNNERVLERLKTDITKFTRADFDEAETLIEIIKAQLNVAKN